MRRFRSRLIASRSTGTPAGKPSTTAVRPGPCDSPAVKKRSPISPAVPPSLPQLLRARKHRRPGGDDLRAEEHEQLLVVVRFEIPLEEPAECRDAPQEREPRLVVLRRVPEDATEDDGLAVA